MDFIRARINIWSVFWINIVDFLKKFAVQNNPQERKYVGCDAWFCHLEVIKKNFGYDSDSKYDVVL